MEHGRQDRLNRLEAQVDTIVVSTAKIDVTLAKQQVLLEEHMRRSLANEAQVDSLRKQMLVWAVGLIAMLLTMWFKK